MSWQQAPPPTTFVQPHVPQTGRPGEHCHFHKLKNEEVLDIRQMSGSAKRVGLLFSVSKNTVLRIRRRETWKHI
jgi:hypothetical protein